MTKLCVVAAGGTGGHMFPAEALARELAERGWRVVLATDRRGEQFPVLCAYGCRCEIENGKTLVLADKPEVFRCGLRYGRLRFTTETAAECAALLRAHRAGTVTADDNSTRGLFYRGVE